MHGSVVSLQIPSDVTHMPSSEQPVSSGHSSFASSGSAAPNEPPLAATRIATASSGRRIPGARGSSPAERAGRARPALSRQGTSLTVNVSGGVVPPPGPGVKTVISSVPGAPASAVRSTVSCRAFTNVVRRLWPSTRTREA